MLRRRLVARWPANNTSYGAAIDDFAQALRINPAYVQALTARGSAYYRAERCRPLCPDLDAALALNPKDATALVTRPSKTR
jgi:tetratricopeptide (TPR) repeat protein